MYRSIEIHRALSWWRCRNFNPRSPDGERPQTIRGGLRRLPISIHAPRMGSDVGVVSHCRSPSYFNPHSPDGERLSIGVRPESTSEVFQSTLPGWGATRHIVQFPVLVDISIHAPRMGSDASFDVVSLMQDEFQSTLPGWGATLHGLRGVLAVAISIHAPRMGSDCNRIFKLVRILISIHAPRMGSDNSWSPTFHPIGNFNPRSPDGERRRRWLRLPRFSWYFNPRSPDGERRAHAPPTPPKPANFNPRSPDGERLSSFRRHGRTIYFNPRSPDGERPNSTTDILTN